MALSAAILVELDITAFRRLVAGMRVTRQIDGYQRVALLLDPAISARDMLFAVAAGMGDDPPAAAELSRGRRK